MQKMTTEEIGFAYDQLRLLRMAGIRDITEGKYVSPFPNAQTQTWQEYLNAQTAQVDFLLDQICCDQHSKILDIGCGNGYLLERAERRGARSLGITLSPTQVRYCEQRGLHVQLMNYRHMPFDWHSSFTGVVANGSLEHFAQVKDAVQNEVDGIYRDMFERVRALLVPPGHFATTAIHFRSGKQVDPRALQRGCSVHPRGSTEYHFALILKHVLHGWLPEPGQLARCAEGLFKLVYQEEATRDYYLTSEFWLRIAWQALWRNPRIWFLLGYDSIRHPFKTWSAFRHYMWDQSWMWQFRGEDPPTRLYRHTWQAI